MLICMLHLYIFDLLFMTEEARLLSSEILTHHIPTYGFMPDDCLENLGKSIESTGALQKIMIT